MRELFHRRKAKNRFAVILVGMFITFVFTSGIAVYFGMDPIGSVAIAVVCSAMTWVIDAFVERRW